MSHIAPGSNPVNPANTAGRQTRAPLTMKAGSNGYFLHAIGTDDEVLATQPEGRWAKKLKDAEKSAIDIAERTGIAVLVVRVVGRVVPWHQGRTRPQGDVAGDAVQA